MIVWCVSSFQSDSASTVPLSVYAHKAIGGGPPFLLNDRPSPPKDGRIWLCHVLRAGGEHSEVAGDFMRIKRVARICRREPVRIFVCEAGQRFLAACERESLTKRNGKLVHRRCLLLPALRTRAQPRAAHANIRQSHRSRHLGGRARRVDENRHRQHPSWRRQMRRQLRSSPRYAPRA